MKQYKFINEYPFIGIDTDQDLFFSREDFCSKSNHYSPVDLKSYLENQDLFMMVYPGLLERIDLFEEVYIYYNLSQLSDLKMIDKFYYLTPKGKVDNIFGREVFDQYVPCIAGGWNKIKVRENSHD